jgi:hypothetical protein
MTRDDIIRMAKEAGWHDGLLAVTFTVPLLERFAALVAAAEREACAKVCDEKYEAVPKSDPYAEADGDYSELIYAGAAQDCADAIRARGER